MTKTITTLAVADLRSTYSGKDGACCCGCAGKHSYRSDLREEAGKDRGYPIGDDEIDDAKIARTLRIVQRAVEKGEPVELTTHPKLGSHVAYVRGTRLHILYLRKSVGVTTHVGKGA